MKLESVCEKVVSLAKEVGIFIQTEAASFSKDKIEYKGLNDLVSYVDKEAERKLVSGLKTILPEALFLTEEGTEGVITEDDLLPDTWYWIIDPIDGTTNFIHGLPIFSTSIGLVKNKQVYLGVVTDITRNDCFYAWKDGGAWLNGKPIKVSPTKTMAEGLFATGFPYSKFDKVTEYLAIVDEMLQKSHGLRRMGSAAIDLAYVSCGRFEGFFESNLKAWDVAGGICLVQEAGGTITDFTLGDNALFGKEIIASANTGAEMQEIIARNWFKK